VWIFRPADPPRSLVVFVHGLGLGETTPVNHRPWLEHLARQGNAVIYPRYERNLGSRLAVRHLVVGVRLAFRRLGSPKLPLVAIGYSRGGELVADYAAVARLAGPPPAEVLTVFPAGDHDSVVDGAGGHQLLVRLAAAGFPPDRISVTVIRSRGGFVATHLAPLQVTPAAKAAFWAPADRTVDRARARTP